MKSALALTLAIALFVFGTFAIPAGDILSLLDASLNANLLEKELKATRQAKAAVMAPPTDLFISEYIEGTGSNRAIEIYNGTSAAINMDTAGYIIQLYADGSSIPTQTALSTGLTVPAGGVVVLAHPSASAGVLALAGYTNSALINFTGNDTLVLRKGGASGPIVDVIGQIGNNPVTEWGAGLTSTLNNTIVRKSTICAGDSNGSDSFNPATEWDGFAQDTTSNLGTHTANCIEFADFTNLQFPSTITVDAGQVTEQIYGRIYEAGVTEAAGENASVTAEIGYGPFGSDPRTSPDWTFSVAAFNTQVGNDDEYAATITAPSPASATQYAYTYRFSVDGGANWTYADLNGNGTNGGLSFETTQLGTMTVNAANPEIDVTPGSMSFGTQPVGSTSGTRSVTISNGGNANLNIGALVKGGANASEFSVTADPSSTVVAPGGTAKLRVTFSPADEGSRTAQISIPSNDSDEPSVVVTLTGTGTSADMPGPVKSMWVWGGAPDPVADATGRTTLYTRSLINNITDIYLNVYQSTANSQGRLMYESTDMDLLIATAHSAGIKVWAAYGDPAWQDQGCSDGEFAYERMQEVAAFNAERPVDHGFDGVMIDVEPGGAFDLTNYASMHDCFRGILPTNMKLGTAINAFWEDPVEYPAGGETKPEYEHIVDLPLDQIVVMGYRDNSGISGGNGMIGLDEDEIEYASLLGKAGLVLAGMETKDLSNPPEEHVTFFEEGNAVMTSESVLVSTHFNSSVGFGGFSIHAYQDAFLSGTTGWPIGPSAAQVSISGRVTTAHGVGIRGAAIRVTGMDGSVEIAYTNSFGYYRVEDLTAGEAVIVSVTARRYAFAEPTQLVNPGDNISGLNFVSLP